MPGTEGFPGGGLSAQESGESWVNQNKVVTLSRAACDVEEPFNPRTASPATGGASQGPPSQREAIRGVSETVFHTENQLHRRGKSRTAERDKPEMRVSRTVDTQDWGGSWGVGVPEPVTYQYCLPRGAAWCGWGREDAAVPAMPQREGDAVALSPCLCLFSSSESWRPRLLSPEWSRARSRGWTLQDRK